MHLDLTLYEEALGGAQGGGHAVVVPFILSLTQPDHALMLRWSSPPTSTPSPPTSTSSPPTSNSGAEGTESAEGAAGAPLSQRALLAQLGAIQQHLERRGEHLVVGTYCSKHISNTAPP